MTTIRGLVAVLALAGSVPVTLGADTIEGILETRGLESAYNPVLLEYLLEEGATVLPEAQRTLAVDQLVAALKQDVEITPEEQRTAALLAASAAAAELFGGRDGSELGAAAGDATYDVWRGWVDSARTLQRAGYAAEAEAFFEKCIQIYPYSDLRGRCAIALAAGKPEEAVERLMALTESNDTGTINAALRLLGRLAGSPGFPEEQRSAVVTRLTEFTGGLKKASYGLAACQGLVATGDPAAVPTLQKLSKGMMNQDFHRCARRGLLLGYGDDSVVPLLEKQLGGGKFSSTEPWDRFFAATLLMEGSVESGFEWAREQFAKGGKKGGKGFMKRMMATEEEVDFQPALVNALVRVGGERAQHALTEAKGLVEAGTWIETWIAIGLLELGDPTFIDLARQALDRPDWEFTVVRVATALAEHGDHSGIPALVRLDAKAAKGVEPETGKAVVAFLGGAGDLYLADRGEREDRLVRLRRQIADALATIDRPESTKALETMLETPEESVRIAAAYALARMSDPSATRGMAKAIGLDYGSVGAASRNPVVHAHLARRAAGRSGVAAVIAKAEQSPDLSVRFLALCLEQQPGT